MTQHHLWNKAKSVKIQTSSEIAEGFSLGFDKKIPEAVKNALIDFVYWAEDSFSFPVTLWVDFKYNHYLMDQAGNRVGYRFYWADFKNYPHFDDPDDIPVIELPVRLEHSAIDEILFSFIEAISHYYAWLTNSLTEDFQPDETQTAEVLYTYLNETNQEVPYGDF